MWKNQITRAIEDNAAIGTVRSPIEESRSGGGGNMSSLAASDALRTESMTDVGPHADEKEASGGPKGIELLEYPRIPRDAEQTGAVASPSSSPSSPMHTISSSFASAHDQVDVKWFVDGWKYYEAV